jgi:hypothetical protein
LNDLKIKETPVILYPDKRNRKSHLRTWRDGWRHFRFLLLYSPRWLFLYPGIFLLILGLIGTVLLIPWHGVVGTKRLDVHTLVYIQPLYLPVSNLLPFTFFQAICLYTRAFTSNEKFLSGFKNIFALKPVFLQASFLL